MRKLPGLLLIWLLVLGLAACGPLAAAGPQPPPPQALPEQTPAHSAGSGAASDPSASPSPAATADPGASLAPGGGSSSSGGIVYATDRFVGVKGTEGERQLLPLPATAGRLALGPLGLAYIDGNRLQVLHPFEGTTQTWFSFPERAGQDFELRWSDDGLALGYAVAWNEPDGSRMVELGFFEGAQGTRVDVRMARQPGATPTPPSMAPVPPLPGFANLHIVGFDGADGHLAVTPVGGEDRYSAVWFYDLSRLKRDGETLVNVEVHEMALSPDQTRLAVVRTGTLEVWCLGTDAPPLPAPVPENAHAARLHWSPDGQRLAYLVNDGPATRLDAGITLGLWVWEGGHARQVMAFDELVWLVGWAPGYSAVVVAVLDPANGQWIIKLVDVESGESQALFTMELGNILGWLPDQPR